jgi:PhzF family phenazine biosynthesis protein
MTAQPIYIVDSFTDQAFKGNPAGVHLSEQQPEEDRMQSIASELNLSETAFVSPASKSDSYTIRYFSPKMEIPLCGHATLAAAKVIFGKYELEEVNFCTFAGLKLPIRKTDGLIEMTFPVYELRKSDAPAAMLAALGVKDVNYAGFNEETNILMLEIESADELVALKPDFPALLDSHHSINGVSVTAKATDNFDFYSRFFWPWSGGEEDPVTGAAHTFLAKYWADKLGKSVLRSFQASRRTGVMEVEVTPGNELLIRGQAVLVLEGQLRI